MDIKEKAALYVRVSTKYQIDKDSLPFQKKKLKEFCKLLNIPEYEIFEDDGYSAKNTDRPKYQEMMHKIRSGEFTKLIVYKVDRVSRNLLDFANMYAELKKYHVSFISMNEQFDTSTAIGEAMLKIILVFAELERNMTSERVTGIMLNRAEEGLWNGARMPSGYKWDEEKKFPVPDKEESKYIHFIYDEYEKTHSCTQVCRKMNAMGLKGKRGGNWTSKNINDIIRNPFYIGTYRYNVREKSRGKLKPQSEWIVRENNHTPIISVEQFERCNAIMDKNKEKNTAAYRHDPYVHIFSGKLKCTHCGGGFQANKDKVRSNGFRPTVYRCSHRAALLLCPSKSISDGIVGPFVFNYIANMLKVQKDFIRIGTSARMQDALLRGEPFKDIAAIDSDDLLNTYNILLFRSLDAGGFSPNIMTDALSETQSHTEHLDIYYNEREKHKKAIDRLTELYIYDPEALPKDSFLMKRKDLQNKIAELDDKIAKIKASTNITDTASNLEFMKKASAFLINKKLENVDYIDYVALTMELDRQALKNFVYQMIDCIYVTSGRVTGIRFINGLEHHFIYKEV